MCDSTDFGQDHDEYDSIPFFQAVQLGIKNSNLYLEQTTKFVLVVNPDGTASVVGHLKNNSIFPLGEDQQSMVLNMGLCLAKDPSSYHGLLDDNKP